MFFVPLLVVVFVVGSVAVVLFLDNKQQQARDKVEQELILLRWKLALGLLSTQPKQTDDIIDVEWRRVS
jgi:hypothetical protein